MNNNDAEILRIGFSDFIDLGLLAESQARESGNRPDIFFALRECFEKGVSVAVWGGAGKYVWRFDKPPFVGKGDYITYWSRPFFLSSSFVREVIDGRCESLSCSRFYAHEEDDIALDGLEIASSSEHIEYDLKQAVRANIQAALEEYGVAVFEDIPYEERKWIDVLATCAPDEQSDDGYIEFDVKEIKVLRSDLVKLGLDGIRPKSGSQPVPKVKRSLADQVSIMGEETAREWVRGNIEAYPEARKPKSRKEYVEEYFSILGLDPDPNTEFSTGLTNPVDFAYKDSGIAPRLIADTRTELGFRTRNLGKK